MGHPSAGSRIARFGLFEADLGRRVLTRKGLRVRLQEQPFRVLILLLERPADLITREEIQQKLWPADTFVAFDDGLNTAIKKLRLALEDSADNPVFIETVPRRGYRFLAPVSYAETSATNASAGNGHVPSSENEPGTLPTETGTTSSLVGREASRGMLAWSAVLALVVLACGILLWRASSSHAAGTVDGSSAALRSGRHSIDPRARDEYLQARSYWKLRTAEALTKAVDHFNIAIEIDPNYAEAYAGLANCYVVLPMLTTVSSEDTTHKAQQAADKAIAIDNSVAQAHLARGEILLYSDWKFTEAEKEFRTALSLDSEDPQIHQWYAEFLSLMGRHSEAISEIQAAAHLDPSSMIVHHQAGQIYQSARMYREALQEYRRALMIQPGFGPTYSSIALAYRRLDQYADALEAERQANAYWEPGGTASKDLQAVVTAYRTGGKRGFLQATLEFNKKHPGFAYYFAFDYALLGDNDRALQWLQKALDAHQALLLNMQNDPELDSLRGDPRFQAIVAKIGFPSNGAAALAER